MYKIIIGVLIAMFVVIFIFTKIDPNLSSNASSGGSEGEFLTVSVEGEVTREGTYLLDTDTTLGDLIEAAGGQTDNADELAFNVSCDLIDNMTYYIAPLFAEDDVCANELLVKVGLNKGQKEDFMTIDGIGSSIASAIISYREDNGPYQYLEEVMDVSGIGNATFIRIRNSITLQ